METNQLTKKHIKTQNEKESEIVSTVWNKHFGDRHTIGIFDPEIDNFFDELSKALPPLTKSTIN